MADGTCTANGCEDPRWGLREWCSKHWQRVKKYGKTELPDRPCLEEKFWSKVDRSGDCWIWTGAVNSRGVLLFWDSVTGKTRHANRIAYELTRGRPLPEGRRARRSCGESLCLRPEHLVATPEERFWSKVEKTDGCWNWSGRLNDSGYGVFTIGGKDKFTAPAHRWSYELLAGPIPDGLDIDHVCRNRACVNPVHLRPATKKQNTEHQVPTRRKSASGLRGVFPKDGRWRAGVRHNGKLHYAGYFDTPAEAAEAARLLRNRFFTRNNLDRDIA